MSGIFRSRLEELGALGAGAVFVVSGRRGLDAGSRREGDGAAATPTFELGAGLEGLPPSGTLDHVLLGTAAEDLDVVQLRRFLHRASRLLRPGGVALWSDLDPEAAERAGTWPGASGPAGARHRPIRHHLELIRLFPLRVLTPRAGPGAGRLGYGALRSARAPAFSRNPTRAEPIAAEDRARHAETRYGRDSLYRRFDRLAEPEIVDDLLFALASMRLRGGRRLLAIGCNDGRELELVSEVAAAGAEGAGDVECWGIDLSESAIAAARARFPAAAERFLAADASRLDELDLPDFDAVLILNTLQCRTLDRDRLLRGVLARLRPRACVLISIPDCHHGEFDVLRRPLDRDDPRQDRSVVHKEMRFLARFFHRARFRHVSCFGSYDAFVLARR